MKKAIFLFLYLLPKNYISQKLGRWSYIHFNDPHRVWILRFFTWLFRIDMADAELYLDEYRCFGELFTRRLHPQARVFDETPEGFLSPCDGKLGEVGIIEKDTALQVKGRPYSISKLLNKPVDLEGGIYITFYLSPKDYHRFHAPCDLEIDTFERLDGYLWPVNSIGLEYVPELFCVNERLIANCMQHEKGFRFYFVPVGATLVGSIYLSDEARDRALQKGEELGGFGLGSTIVICMPKGVLELMPHVRSGMPVQAGQLLGKLL